MLSSTPAEEPGGVRTDPRGVGVGMESAFFIPRTSAGERSSSADKSRDGSSMLGPPRACTPVYVDYIHKLRFSGYVRHCSMLQATAYEVNYSPAGRKVL